MPNSRLLIALAIVLAIALFVVAGVYFAEPAKSLPSFFPGHSAGSTTHHIKHGIASVVVGLALLVFAWFATGPRKTAAARPER
jgi:protein-S-isoprenylcysteine O-methyltransferase Ste14